MAEKVEKLFDPLPSILIRREDGTVGLDRNHPKVIELMKDAFRANFIDDEDKALLVKLFGAGWSARFGNRRGE